MIKLYEELKDFLLTYGVDEINKRNQNESTKSTIDLINILPDVSYVDSDFIVFFAWEILEGNLENLYNLHYKQKLLHLYARKMLGANIDSDKVDLISRPQIRIPPTESLKQYIIDKYKIYSDNTVHFK